MGLGTLTAGHALVKIVTGPSREDPSSHQCVLSYRSAYDIHVAEGTLPLEPPWPVIHADTPSNMFSVSDLSAAVSLHVDWDLLVCFPDCRTRRKLLTRRGEQMRNGMHGFKRYTVRDQ